MAIGQFSLNPRFSGGFGGLEGELRRGHPDDQVQKVSLRRLGIVPAKRQSVVDVEVVVVQPRHSPPAKTDAVNKSARCTRRGSAGQRKWNGNWPERRHPSSSSHAGQVFEPRIAADESTAEPRTDHRRRNEEDHRR